MSDDKELTYADFAAMFRLGPEKITMTKADAIRLAELMQRSRDEIARLRAALATARRDALAEIKQDTDEAIELGRQDGMEYAAQIADGRPSDCGEDVAAAIRAAAKEENQP